MKKQKSVILVLFVIFTLACSFSLPKTDPTAVPPSPEPNLTTALPPSEAPPTLSPDLPPPPAVRIVSIHANSNISLAIDDQGRVWQWGNYQLGPNNSPCKGGDACLLTPALVPNLTDVVAISAGFTHRMALKSDGTLWGWGQNERYQLGLGYGDKAYHEEPVQVPGMTDVAAVSAGDNFTLALKKDGTVWAWGGDSAGQLGNGKDSYTPDYPLYQENPGPVVNLGNVTAVDTGWHHGMVLRSDGTVWTWGFNQLGELGWGTADTQQHPEPKQVPGLTDVTGVSAGFNNSLVQKQDGSVWVWGGNLGGQLDSSKLGDAQPYPNPMPLDAFADAVQVDACSMQLAALKSDGSVWLVGFGEIDMQSGAQLRQTPLKDMVAISCAEDHLLALDRFGVVWAWGNNNVGQLGRGSMEASPDPQPVLFP